MTDSYTLQSDLLVYDLCYIIIDFSFGFVLNSSFYLIYVIAGSILWVRRREISVYICSVMESKYWKFCH